MKQLLLRKKQIKRSHSGSEENIAAVRESTAIKHFKNHIIQNHALRFSFEGVQNSVNTRMSVEPKSHMIII